MDCGALEPFDDVVYGEEGKVKVRERRIVPPNLLFRRKSYPLVKEHVYELTMEKKPKHLIETEERKQD